MIFFIITLVLAFILFSFYFRSQLGLITLALFISFGILYSRFLLFRPQLDISVSWLEVKTQQFFPFIMVGFLILVLLYLVYKFFPEKIKSLYEKFKKFQTFYWENSFEALHRFLWKSKEYNVSFYDRLVYFLEFYFPSQKGAYQNVVLGLLIIFPFIFLNILFVLELLFFHSLFYTFQFLWILLFPQAFRLWLAIKNDLQLRGGLTFLMGLEKCFGENRDDIDIHAFCFRYKEERVLEVLDHAMKIYPECFTFWNSSKEYLEDCRCFLLDGAAVLNLQTNLLPQCRKFVFFGSLANIVFQFILFYILNKYFFF